MGRLKILFITSWYPTKERPVDQLFVREHAKAAALYDDVVVLHCVSFDPHLKQTWRLEREHDQGLSEGVATYRLWWRLSPIPKTSYLLYLWSVWRAARQIAAEGFRPDVIHAHVYEAAVPAVLAGKLLSIPVTVTEHFSAFPRRTLSWVDLWKARLAFRAADIVLPVSKALQQAIRSYGIRARFEVVPNVVDTKLFSPDPEGAAHNSHKRLLFTGRLESSHIKGMPQLLQALARLAAHRAGWQLDVIGDGPARPEYEKLATQLGVDRHVTFHGVKSKAEIASYMRQADLFVLPSLWENLPCVIIEAMASGLPVLSTAAGGIPELVDGARGRLVAPGDVDALHDELDHLLDTLDAFAPHEISRYAVEHFSLERVGQQLHHIYQALQR
jgi:glycosyltransferase involved in cell wall biosynthesis